MGQRCAAWEHTVHVAELSKIGHQLVYAGSYQFQQKLVFEIECSNTQLR